MQRQSSYILLVHYQKNLKFSENEILDNKTNFLDLRIIINEQNNLTFDFYDKHNDFLFKVNFFTHYYSYLRKSVYVNILLNIAHRNKNICSNK